MAKRLSDSLKWSDKWFRELSLEAKAFWLFYLDSCDVAGIWKEDFEGFKFATRVNFSHDDILRVFSDRIFLVQSGVYFCPRFIKFQNMDFYNSGLTNPKNGAHRGIINALNYYDLIPRLEEFNVVQSKGYLTVTQGLPNPYIEPKEGLNELKEGLPNPTSIGIGIGTGICIGIGIGTGTINTVHNAKTVPSVPKISDGIDEAQYTFRQHPTKSALRNSIKNNDGYIVDEIKK